MYDTFVRGTVFFCLMPCSKVLIRPMGWMYTKKASVGAVFYSPRYIMIQYLKECPSLHTNSCIASTRHGGNRWSTRSVYTRGPAISGVLVLPSPLVQSCDLYPAAYCDPKASTNHRHRLQHVGAGGWPRLQPRSRHRSSQSRSHCGSCSVHSIR